MPAAARSPRAKARACSTAQVGQRRPGRPGVEPPVDVAVRLAVPDQHQPAAHRRSPVAVTQLTAATASPRRVRGGSAPAADPVGHEPRYRTSCTTTVQRLECLGDRDVVDVTDAVQEEHVGAEFGSGGPGFDPGQVDVADAELGQRRDERARARCRCAGPPRCGRRRCAPAAAPGGPTRTNRVRAFGSSTTPSASVVQAVALRGQRRAHPGVGPAGEPPPGPRRALELAGTTCGRRQVLGQPAPDLRGGDRERRDGRDVRGRGTRPHHDAERHVEGQFGEHLQRRHRWPGCPASAAPIPRSSSRSARRRSRRCRPAPLQGGRGAVGRHRLAGRPRRESVPAAVICSNAASVNVPSGPR